MITITPKDPSLSPVAYQAYPFSFERPWSRLQILGGRQAIVFDADGDVMGTFDLALTANVQLIRRENIVGVQVSADGATVQVQSRQPIALGPSSVTEPAPPSAQGDGDAGDDGDNWIDDFDW